MSSIPAGGFGACPCVCKQTAMGRILFRVGAPQPLREVPIPERKVPVPENYTHAYIATQALMRSGQTVASHQAYLAGANGPDPLYMYKPGAKQRRPDLPKLADKMHREKTGEFLLNLASYAVTPAQQSYVMGFFTHYTTDITLYPYIAAMTAQGRPYAGRGGQARMETALDSTLYYKNFKTHLVPLQAGTPVLITEDLAQVTTLLHESIRATYGYNIPPVALADIFHDNLRLRRRLIAKKGPGRLLAGLRAASWADNKSGGTLKNRMQPSAPLKTLPDIWTNPYTGEQLNLTLDEILTVAEHTGAAAVIAALHYWLGELDEPQLAEILGNNSYFTGLALPPVSPQGLDMPPFSGLPAENEPPAQPAPAPPAAPPPLPNPAPPAVGTEQAFPPSGTDGLE